MATERRGSAIDNVRVCGRVRLDLDTAARAQPGDNRPRAGNLSIRAPALVADNGPVPVGVLNAAGDLECSLSQGDRIGLAPWRNLCTHDSTGRRAQGRDMLLVRVLVSMLQLRQLLLQLDLYLCLACLLRP